MIGPLVIVVVTVLGIASPAGAQAPVEVRVRIEAGPADAVDAVRLLERLNANGEEDNLRFQLVQDGYDFRIAFGSEGFALLRGADARAAVLTPDCNLLFIVARQGRFTQAGALNALTKEIAKGLALYLKAPKPGQTLR